MKYGDGIRGEKIGKITVFMIMCVVDAHHTELCTFDVWWRLRNNELLFAKFITHIGPCCKKMQDKS